MDSMKDHSKQKRPQRFLSKVFDKKKGGYLLSRIALFDKVYHRCMDSMKDHSKRKRPQRFLSKVFDKKKGGYLLSRIALQYHRRKWA